MWQNVIESDNSLLLSMFTGLSTAETDKHRAGGAVVTVLWFWRRLQMLSVTVVLHAWIFYTDIRTQTVVLVALRRTTAS